MIIITLIDTRNLNLARTAGLFNSKIDTASRYRPYYYPQVILVANISRVGYYQLVRG